MRTVFITGVSRGLGQALSTSLDDGNTRLVGFGRTQGDFAGTFHTCDFSKPQLASSILESALESENLSESDSIVFIANAGHLGLLAKAQDLDAFEIEQTIASNLIGSAITVSTFLKFTQNLNVPKTFIQITSGAALPDRAKASWSLYCSSKAGQEQLIRSVAKEQENAAHPCCLINVNPGVMETSMQVEIRKTSPEAFPEVERFKKMKEEGRIPSPDTIASRISDLLSKPSELENAKTYSLAE